MDAEGGLKPLGLLAIIEASSITGPAKNLLEFAGLATEQGVETTVATFVRGTEANLFVETARKQSTAVHTIAERSPFDRAALGALRELVSQIKPELIQTHAVKSHFLARLSGVTQQAPWIAFHHGYTWPAWRARVYNELDRWSLRAPVKVLTVSEPFRRELERKGVRGERIEIIHNAIRPDWGAAMSGPEAARLRAELHIAPERKVILIVGRLSREKDHLTLLQAVNGLRSRLAACVVVVGEGPERPIIERKIQELGLEGSVLLVGQRKSAEPYYGIADVAVLSSLSEGSPNALLEAMAARVPVVATDVGGIPEMVTHGESALLLKPGDAGAMADAIARVIENPRLGESLAARAHALVVERHNPERRTTRLVEIYRRLAQQGIVQ